MTYFSPWRTRLDPNWTNSELFQTRFRYSLAEPKCTEIISDKSPGFVIYGTNQTRHGPKYDSIASSFYTDKPGMVGLAPKWVRLAPNGTNPGAPNALKSDLKKPRICPIWSQSDPLWSQTYHPWYLYII